MVQLLHLCRVRLAHSIAVRREAGFDELSVYESRLPARVRHHVHLVVALIAGLILLIAHWNLISSVFITAALLPLGSLLLAATVRLIAFMSARRLCLSTIETGNAVHLLHLAQTSPAASAYLQKVADTYVHFRTLDYAISCHLAGVRQQSRGQGSQADQRDAIEDLHDLLG